MTLRTYILGFTLSVMLTLAAFWFVGQNFSREVGVVVLVALALTQLIIQLVCFLHLGAEQKPRWHLITFVFAAFIVLVLVGGTIWIMYHLDQGHGDLEEIYPLGEISPQAQDD
jgi:cytochrome o ubiquinol oxidase operon protein cyoD